MPAGRAFAADFICNVQRRLPGLAPAYHMRRKPSGHPRIDCGSISGNVVSAAVTPVAVNNPGARLNCHHARRMQ
jgi:hypothetical protein